ncbi:hypothetical protein INR49_001578, partial [Caranx melampygus]
MKMKSAKKKSKRAERQHTVVIVKTENDPELGGEAEEGSTEVYTNGDGLCIHIKEEPHAQEIWEQECNGDTSGTKPDTVTSRSDAQQHQQGHIKDECDSDHQSECELSEAAVKEEQEEEEEEETWIKQDRDSEEEAEGTGNTQEGYGEGEEGCAESSSEFFPCPHCTVSFTDLDFLEKHVKLHPCPTCARSFQYLKNLKNHCQRWHKMSVVTTGDISAVPTDHPRCHLCLHCIVSFADSGFLQQHF